MDRNRIQNQKDMMQEWLLTKIRQIVKDEKFKLDAFYLCGVASSLPNQSLQTACENYLAMVDGGQSDQAIISNLITELEKAISNQERLVVVGDLVNNMSDIQAVFAHKSFL